MELTNQYHVKVLSDEIHGDITYTESGYTPAFSLPEELIQNLMVSVSPSKTFNVAALHAATLIIPNEDLRNIVNRGINSDEISEPNSFAIPATIAAYEKGHQWLAELKEKLQSNRELVTDFVRENIPDMDVVKSDATYLMWLDVSKITNDSHDLAASIRENTGLYLSAGDVYRGDGQYFLRLNVACPSSMVKDGLSRLAEGIKIYQN